MLQKAFAVHVLCEAKKTAPFYFCSISIKPLSVLIIFGIHYATINLLSPVYFTFFIKSKTGNQLKFQQYSTLPHCSHTVFVARCRMSSQHPNYGFLTSQTLMMWTTESGQCYGSETINSLFEMSMSWGDVSLTPGQAFSRRSLIKQ